MATGQGMRIAEEQAALRRVATLVAQGAPPEEVMTVVTAEVGGLLDVGHINLVRYETDGAATTVGAWARPGASAPFSVGAALRLGGRNVTTQVFETGRPARFDDYGAASGMIGEAVWGERGVRSAVGAPICVEGRLWGCIVTASTSAAPLPADTEERLAGFAELMATALANAQARMELRAFATEQAALRRVATLVAGAASPAEVFAAVAIEIGGVLGVDYVDLLRYEGGDTAAVVGVHDATDSPHAERVGDRLALGGRNVVTQVCQTGRAVRLDDYSQASGAFADAGRAWGVGSCVGVPISVAGALWGTVTVANRPESSLPADIEARLVSFVELVESAIANMQARLELRGFAEEQAALRRVATLVARGAASAEMFRAVAAEIGRLLHSDVAVVVRYSPDRTGTVVGQWSVPGIEFPDRGRLRVEGHGAVAGVLETGRTVRVDTFEGPEGSVADRFAQLGARSGVGAPVLVEGRLWGVVVAASIGARSLPAGSEERLAGFAELTATAIANVQARTDLRRSADEQAALRTVATLVARAAPPEVVFAAVAAEIGRLLAADVTTVTRYDAGDVATVLGAWSGKGAALPVPIGTRTPLGGRNIATRVFHGGRPVRMDDYGEATGEAADAGRTFGVRGAAGAPITVEGRLWGLMTAVSTGDVPLPPDADTRLAHFAQLVATAIANAQARSELGAFAEEQAALREVATLVARGAPAAEVFAAVTAQAGRLLDADLMHMNRFDPDGRVTVVGAWARGDDPVPAPVGSRLTVGGQNVTTRVLRTGRPARIDRYGGDAGEAPAAALAAGMRAAVGVPITVQGELWGVMILAFTRVEPPPADTEERLAAFTGLVGTAIANAQARTELGAFAEEQAALRQVATLVARGVAPEELFGAVTAEVGRVLGCEDTVMSRFDADDAATVVGAWSTPGLDIPVPVGRRLPLGDRNVHTLVARTHRSVRLDSYGPDAGAAPAAALAVGMHSAVGTPIEVGGRLWGVMIAASRGAPLPVDTEARLAGFTELVATAVANAEAQAQLAASRARVVATADATRRRIERDLHDGVQQHLVSLALELRVAQEALAPDGATAAQLDRVAEGLRGVLDELREVTRGIHSAALAQGGLAPALKALARRSPVPVRLDVRVDGRLPSLVEQATYYTVAEALNNAAKHASATVVDVIVSTGEGILRLEVRDDGRGGAVIGSGSGLVGLTDRAEALGGRLTVNSPPGGGTTVQVALPLAVPTTNADG